MKIAIDAIGINKFGGGRTATLYLLQALFQLDSQNEYVVAVSAFEPTFESQHKNVTQWVIPVRNRFLVRLYAQLIFPFRFRDFNVIHFTKNLNFLGTSPPQVVTVYDMTHVLHPELIPKIDHWYYKTVQKYMLRVAKRIIAISHDAGEGVHRIYGIPWERIRVIHLAAADHFKPASREEIERIRLKYSLPDPYFIHVGHLDKKKNLTALINAFYLVKQRTRFKGKLVLVGEKYPKGHDPNLFLAIENLGLQEDVIFPGGVPDEDLPAMLSGAIAKVFPSIHEGFGLAPLEAMACATPVIAGSAGAVSEVVGDAGILLGSTEPDHITEAMIRILKDPELRAEFSRKGYERSKQFSWKKAAQQTLAVYQEVAKK